MGTPPVDRQMNGQTRVKTLPSRRTTYAGGKNGLIYLVLAKQYLKKVVPISNDFVSTDFGVLKMRSFPSERYQSCFYYFLQ